MKLRNDCDQIVRRAIAAVQPDAAVRRALEGNPFQGGRVVLVAVGKAAWSMARAACDCVGGRLDGGIVITKHGHAQGPIGSLLIREAGHPVPDQDTFSATEEALALTDGLTAEDTVLFLLSGGGSALFEAPLVPQEELQSITQSLLASGADIVEMNTIRKRLSAVKGGRFAQHCAPAKVFSIVLSDIIGDPLDMIASGPAYPDSSTCADARRIAEQYRTAAAQHAALEQRAQWVGALAATVGGTLTSKQKIKLEAYIQMDYLDRILRHANLRLMQMTDAQYELERIGAENQRSQSGLDLGVIDHYNGTRRSVKTLSGGESFKASLALALGLSDEVQSAAGGIRLDTLFLDEGFGSLDEESLEQAIRVLAGLTEGDRLVGIISHVGALKDRIDRQVVVHKNRTGGSTVELVV